MEYEMMEGETELKRLEYYDKRFVQCRICGGLKKGKGFLGNKCDFFEDAERSRELGYELRRLRTRMSCGAEDLEKTYTQKLAELERCRCKGLYGSIRKLEARKHGK